MERMKLINCYFQCLGKKEIKSMSTRWGVSELYSSALQYGRDRSALSQERLKIWLWEKSVTFIQDRWSLSVEGGESLGGVPVARALQSKENRYVWGILEHSYRSWLWNVIHEYRLK